MPAKERNINDELARIQAALKAPKGQRNTFGNYNYRSCEDIMEAVKPLLNGCALIVSDDIVPVADRVYVRAAATLSLDGDRSITVTAFAREAATKKGMDESQITGSASSYARKYALNGLFAIDDTKDADSTNTHDAPAPTVKIDPKVKKEAIAQVISCLENGDGHGITEIMSEFTPDEKVVLWGSFNSQQRAAIKELTK